MYNKGVSQSVKDLLASKGKYKLDKLQNKPSSKLERVFSRVVINSSKKFGISKQCHNNELVVKGSTEQKTKIPKEGDGAINTVKCYKRFAILADIEEAWGETLYETSSIIKEKGKNIGKSNQSTADTIPLTQGDNSVNTLTDGHQEVLTENTVSEHIKDQLVTTVEGKKQKRSKMDVTTTNSL